MSRWTAVYGIRIWTEIQLPHGRCRRISGEGQDRGRQMLLRWQEFRIRNSLPCPTKACDGPSQHTRRRGQEGPPTPSSKHSYMHKPLRGKPPQEKQWDLSFGLKQGLATHLSVLSVQGFPTSPACCSAWCLRENTRLVTCTPSHHLMCRSLRSLFKHSRKNFLARFLPWKGRTKMEANSKISAPAVTAVLLRKPVPPLPCQGVPRSPTACSRVVPAAAQPRHAGI